MSDRPKTTRKKIAATAQLQQIMADYFYEMDRAAQSGDQKIAWCSSVGPAELLRALGFLVFFPENHGAALGASRMATPLLPIADARGYSPEICSYLRADIGAYLKGVTPLSKSYPGIKTVPKPDVLVFNTNQCRDVQDWYEWYGKRLGVPVIGVYTHRGVEQVSEHHVRSIAEQIKGLVPALEKIAGRKLDPADLEQAVALSRNCSNLWEKVLNTAAHVPSPVTFYDMSIHMAPAVVLRGTEIAVDYYKTLLKELEARQAGNVAAVDGERFRLYWEGMPVWGRLRDHSEMFAALGACVLVSTYCNSWIFTALDPKDPFNSMGRAYTELFIVRADPFKEAYLKRMLEFFKIDGIIYHEAKCCPNNSNSRYGMPQRLEAETGIPSLVIYGDLLDLRLISDEQTKTNVEAFIEQLEENR